MNRNTFGKKAVLVALFAAFTAAGSFIQIPLPGGIPIAVQDMMSMLCGLLLGPVYGALAVLVFLALGCMGLPVFTGKAGINVILYGPTGGFLVGYFLAAVAGCLIVRLFVRDGASALNSIEEAELADEAEAQAQKKSRVLAEAWNWAFITLAAVVATVIAFVCGVIGFHRVKPDFAMSKVIAAVVLPFIPGNLLKIVLMVPLTKKLRPAIRNFAG